MQMGVRGAALALGAPSSTYSIEQFSFLFVHWYKHAWDSVGCMRAVIDWRTCSGANRKRKI